MRKLLLIVLILFLVSCAQQSLGDKGTVGDLDDTPAPSATNNGDDIAFTDDNNYPFYEKGWKKTAVDDIKDKENIYAVSLFNERIHYGAYIRDVPYNLKLLHYEKVGVGKTVTFIWNYDGEWTEDGGLYCVPGGFGTAAFGSIYQIVDNAVLHLFIYNDEIYYNATTTFYPTELYLYIGRLKFDDNTYTWVDDENYRVDVNIVICNHCIDNRGNLYLLSYDGVYLYRNDSKILELVIDKGEWDYYNPNYPLIKIDDVFYTGTYGGIASYNPVTKEQYLWTREVAP